MINYLGGQIDSIFGMQPRERIKVPQPNYHAVNTTNNINVSDSIVGTINTGVVQSLNTSLNQVALKDASFAEAVKRVAEAVASDTNLSSKNKEYALETLTFLSDEAQKTPKARNKSMIKVAAEKIKEVLATSADLAAVVPIIVSLSHKL